MPDKPELVLDKNIVNCNVDMDISSLPSPTISTGAFEPFIELPDVPLQRLPSISRPRVHAQSGPPGGSQSLPAGLGTPISLVIPKRGEFVRQLSQIKLQREKQRIQTPYTAATPTPHSDRFLDQEDVYIAFDQGLRATTWDRIKALGKGSFSRVILATPTLSQVRPELRHLAVYIRVAVKITKLGTRGTTERMQIEEAMRRDVGLVKRLSHPCLIYIHAYNFDEDLALVVLPFYRGGDLFELVSKHVNELSVALVKRLVHDIVGAVAYLHSQNVVHRDIKLENVLINLRIEDLLAIDPVTYPYPVATLTDLGLARAIDPADPMLTTRCGSEDYVPPEIILAQPYDGRQTDTWALGVLVYAVLEGRLPFDAPPRNNSGRVVRTAHRIARNDWAWYKVKEAPSEWDDLKALVEGCLQKRERGRLLATQVLESEWYKAAGPVTVVRQSEIDPCSVFI